METFQIDSLEEWIVRLALGGRTANACAHQEDSSPPNSEQEESQAQEAPNQKIEDRFTQERLLLTVARPAMACEFEVLLNQHQYPEATDVAFGALDFIDELESLLSVYKPRSEFSLINRFGAERPIGVSFDTMQILQLALSAHDWTQGAFDVTAGSLSEVWGFSRRQGKKPNEVQIEQALESVGSQYVALDLAAPSVRLLRSGVKLNPGGIGKGYALDRVSGRILEHGVEDFMIHGGLSSITARGDRHNISAGGGWKVSLKHPWRWEEHLGAIRLRNQALGTSGSGKQFFHFGGQRYSHIIDPRSGWPAQQMMSVTVICPSAAIADLLATAMFVLGPEKAHEFCDAHPSIGAILLYQDAKSGRQRMETCNLDADTWEPRDTESSNPSE